MITVNTIYKMLLVVLCTMILVVLGILVYVNRDIVFKTKCELISNHNVVGKITDITRHDTNLKITLISYTILIPNLKAPIDFKNLGGGNYSYTNNKYFYSLVLNESLLYIRNRQTGATNQYKLKHCYSKIRYSTVS